MAAKKFLRNIGGIITEVLGIQVSSGAANAGDIPALDETGRLHNSMMPVGIGADTAQVEASEALSAGDLVNIWSDGGDFKVRKADASTAGKEAHGFVLSSVTLGADATVYFEGSNDQVTGLAPGAVYLSTTPGAATNTAPTGAGNIVQRVGIASAATNLNFEASQPIQLAS